MSELRRRGAGGFEDKDVFKGIVRWSWPRMMWLMRRSASSGRRPDGKWACRRRGPARNPRYRGGLGLFAIDGIMETDGVLGVARNAETESEGFAGGCAAIALFARQGAHIRIE